MLSQYTPTTHLSANELVELRQRAALTEGALVLSTGKAISPNDVRIVREQMGVASQGNRQSLFG